MSDDARDTIGRRGFIQGGTAALGGLALAGALPRRARAQAGGTVRVLLVGDPFQYAITDLKDNFKEVTGLTAEIESLSYDALQARLVTSFIAHIVRCRRGHRRPDVDRPISG